MKVRLSVSLVAVMLLIPGSGVAAGRSRTPDVFRYYSVALQAGDRVDITCEDTIPEIAYLSDRFIRSSGQGGGGGSSLTQNSQDLYIDGKLATAGASEMIVDENVDGGFTGFGLGYEAESAGRYRAGWASWGGGPLDCTVRKNGVVKPSKAGDRSKATFLMASDFTVGVGVSLPVVQVGPALVLEQEVSGFVFTWLPGGLGAGAGAVVEPDGTVTPASPLFGINVASPKDGTWTYAIAATVKLGGIFGATMVIG